LYAQSILSIPSISISTNSNINILSRMPSFLESHPSHSNQSAAYKCRDRIQGFLVIDDCHDHSS
jgi:hypothetical protein